MYREFYAQLESTWLPQATTVFFLVVFLVALARLYVFRRRPDFDEVAAMPLKDDEVKR